MIITFIISQQQTIPSIRRRVEDLSHAYGSRLPVPGTFYSFPSPEQLSAASLEDLLAMKLGYRAKYIKRPARTHAADGWIFPILNPCPTKTPWTISPAFTALARR